MTTKEKIDYLDKYIDKNWGSEIAELLWHKTCYCTTDEELAELYDKYLTNE
ncbi:MAG: hypothetical protein HFF06_05440 [Oscillospiraceae bacterium]|jgi:hypothetical protein|nr:hypothetical protein [Oscillospiraceae bacterium]